MNPSDSSRSTGHGSASALRRFVTYLVPLAVFLLLIAPQLVRGYRTWQRNSASERLLAAVVAEDLEAAAAALQAGANPNAWDADRGTAMGVTVRNENAPLVELLFDAGADYPASSTLMMAVRSQRLSLVRRLLETGVDPNVSGNHGPLHVSARQGAVDLLELLLEFGADIE
jgi:ankyrin repeat protein